jgi:hypothetical protein
VVVIEQVLRDEGDQEQAQVVSFEARVERLDVAVPLLIAFIAEDLLEAVKGAVVGHDAVGKGTHRVQSGPDVVERHRSKGSHEAGNHRGPESVDPVGTEEIVRVFLAEVIDACHRRAQHSKLETVSSCTAHQGALFHHSVKAVEEVAIIAASTLRVHLVNLHTVEDNIDRVSEDTGGKASEDASGQEVVETGHATRVFVELVIEVAKGPDSSGRVPHSSCKEGVKTTTLIYSVLIFMRSYVEK